jgi:predicted ferric reductase
MSLWQEVTWDIARAGGMSAYILLTLAVALGLALSAQIQSPSKWPRLVNNELHNFLTLLALVFTCIHILAVWLDPFTHFGLNEVLIPLASYYRPVWMSLGIVAFYLGIAIGISTWIRPIIGYQWWRRLHVLTLLIFALVTVHGIATGSDTTQWWALGIYIVSVVLVGGLLIRRLVVPTTVHGRSHPVLAVATAGVLVLGGIWALLGPLQAGWGAIAGTKDVAAASSAQSTSQQPSAQGEQSTQSGDPFASP